MRECFRIFLKAQLYLRSEFGPEPPYYSPADQLIFTHFLNLAHTLQKGWSFFLRLLCDWPTSQSIRA